MSDSPKCPKCGYEWDPGDEQLTDSITYWGYEGGDQGLLDTNCPKCQKPLVIIETVARSWEAKSPEECEEL